jgi:hypothetical protein
LRLQISPRVTARLLGFLVNPSLLLYGTGGVACGRVEQSVPGASVKTPGAGWAAGAGVQWAFTPQWSIGAEYLHIELDGPSANIGGLSVDTKATTDLGRATLNYKFWAIPRLKKSYELERAPSSAPSVVCYGGRDEAKEKARRRMFTLESRPTGRRKSVETARAHRSALPRAGEERSSAALWCDPVAKRQL